MADRAAIVITPERSPVSLDSQRSLFFDSPSVLVAWRNEFSQPVNYALRIWIFDERSRLKGTLDHCDFETLSPHTRGRTLMPLEIPGITLRDRVVVAIVSAASDKVAWRLRETESEQLRVARIAARGSPGRLSLRRDDKNSIGWSCPCECTAIQSACDRRCGTTGRAASNCTPTLDSGCSASCTCK
jgi:hypothetical protein